MIDTDTMTYREFLEGKIDVVDTEGFIVNAEELHPSTKPHQADSTLWGLKCGRALIAMSFGLGKCLGRGTPVLMADGTIKAVEDVLQGEQLMGDDGTPRNVLSLARGHEAMYRITLRNGDSYTCNESHIMSLKVSNGYHGHKMGSVVNTPVRDYLALPEYVKRNCLKHYKVPVNFAEQDIPFDPYLYGAWLGDGDTDRLAWTINSQDTAIVDRIRAFAEQSGLLVNERPGRGCTSYFVSHGRQGSVPAPTASVFVRESVDQDGKRIDVRYLHNSRAIRLQLLAGLLDTDGYLIDNCYEIATKWIGLRDDILYLSRSLGLSVAHGPKVVNGDTYYRIWISGDTEVIPCITREKAGPRLQIKNPLVYGFTVEPLGEGDYYGFEIDGNRRFLLGDFTVTHNTHIQIEMLRLIHERTGQKVMVICPLGVRVQFVHEDGPRLGVRFQYVRTDAEIESADTPFLITNYERVRDGDIDPRKHNLAGVSLDEGSVIRSLGSKTYQVFNDAFSSVPYRYVCTATPSPNEYRELIYYAEFLGIMDHGQALTRWFKRNPDKAGDLQLNPLQEEEFWLWVATWALFLFTPSDLGYDDAGYALPKLNVQWHRVAVDQTRAWDQTDNYGQGLLLLNPTLSATTAAHEKRETMDDRIERMVEIVHRRILREVPRGTQGSNSGLRSEILPGAQGTDKREEPSLAEISPRTISSGNPPSLRGQSGEASGTESPVVLGEQTESGTNQSPQETSGIRPNTGTVHVDAGGPEGCMSHLPESDDGTRSRSRSFNGGSEGSTLPNLQRRSGSVSGERRDSGAGSELPPQFIIWCNLNDEQRAIEKTLDRMGITYSSIYGALPTEEHERRLYEWMNEKTTALIGKPVMLGFGVNLQYNAYISIYVGVGYKFAEFIQSLHRTHRFLQTHPVEAHIIYAESEDKVCNTLRAKWERHDELQERFRGIVRRYGLSHVAIKDNLKRKLGVMRQEEQGERYTVVNNDNVAEMPRLADNSMDLICTSIPFSKHYEYSIQVEDFGHNPDDDAFFDQMDFLIPELLRVLKPGRIAAIHVKDLINYGHATASGFMEIDPFSDKTVAAFRKHGFIFTGRRTIDTDVVRENNSTYRLGYSEMCNDASKMGCGLPEYLLTFRKPPSDNSTARADEPIRKDKSDYSIARWQIDASAHWNSDGNRLVSRYDYEAHVARLEQLEEKGNLPKTYFCEPPAAHSEWIWDDVQFMRSLNATQVRRGVESHLCPLPFDIVERVIRLYSEPGDMVLEPFMGIGTVPYIAIKLGRKAYGIELSPQFYADAAHYCEGIERQVLAPTLFDMTPVERAA